MVGGLCASLILAGLILVQFNRRLNQSVVATQNEINQAQQLQTTVRNLITRIAQAGQSEPALRELLAKHDFRVSFPPTAESKTNP